MSTPTDSIHSQRKFHFKWFVRKNLSRLGLWILLEQLRMIVRSILKKPHEVEFAALGALKLKDGIILDIGANIGQSAVSMRIYDKNHPIVSVEANPLNAPDLGLLKRWLKGFNFHILAFSNAGEKLTFQCPIIDGVPLSQEGTVNPSILAEDGTSERAEITTGTRHFEIYKQDISCSTVDSFVKTLAAPIAFIKLDVQGHEVPVLEGAVETIKTFHPTLFIEAGTNFLDVENFLKGYGYATYQYDPKDHQVKRQWSLSTNMIFQYQSS